MVRATRSGLPPAAVGMMIRSGRVGQVPVWAAAGETAASAAPRRSVLRVSDIRSLPLAAAGLVLQKTLPPHCRELLRIVASSSSRSAIAPAAGSPWEYQARAAIIAGTAGDALCLPRRSVRLRRLGRDNVPSRRPDGRRQA